MPDARVAIQPPSEENSSESGSCPIVSPDEGIALRVKVLGLRDLEVRTLFSRRARRARAIHVPDDKPLIQPVVHAQPPFAQQVKCVVLSAKLGLSLP